MHDVKLKTIICDLPVLLLSFFNLNSMLCVHFSLSTFLLPVKLFFRIIHRNDQDQENEIDSWGQGQSIRRPKPSSGGRPLTPTEIENMVLKAEKEALVSDFTNVFFSE